MKLSLALSALLLTSLQQQHTSLVQAVLYGDEQFGDIDGGKFWVFNSGGISIVDPNTCEVEDTVNSDEDGNLLPGRWYDGVYMEDCKGDVTGDRSSCKKYVVINSAVTLSDSHGQDAGQGEVIFLDAETHKVESRVVVGPRPVHSYSVYTQNQYWTHSDGDGHFYVIDLEDITKHTGNPVIVKIDEANHGKLLWDESPLLQNYGYATSTGEPHLFIIDMITRDQIGTVDFSDQPGCFGSHAIGYAKTNQHLYVECTGFGGMLEFDVSNPKQPTLVKQFMDVTGAIYESPDEKFISVTDKGGSKFHLIQPGPTGSAASVDYTVDIYGHPSTPVWYNAGTEDNEDHNVCLSLTINTNQNHYKHGTGSLACDYYGCSQAKTVEDVEAGICLYETDENGDETNNLLLVDISQIIDVQAGLEPYLQGCNRCADLNNYDEDDGKCICTPNCGSCASNENEDHNASLSGAVCLDLSSILQSDANSRKAMRKSRHLANEVEGSSSHPNAASFVPAGSVQQGSPYPYSPQCGFGRTYRPHKRGGIYDAMPTHYPTNSVSFVNMETFQLKCSVEIGGSPARIIYVPPSGNEIEEAELDSDSDGLSTGAIIGIAVGGLVGIVLIVFIAQAVGKGGDSSQEVHPPRNHGTAEGQQKAEPSDTSGFDDSHTSGPTNGQMS